MSNPLEVTTAIQRTPTTPSHPKELETSSSILKVHSLESTPGIMNIPIPPICDSFSENHNKKIKVSILKASQDIFNRPGLICKKIKTIHDCYVSFFGSQEIILIDEIELPLTTEDVQNIRKTTPGSIKDIEYGSLYRTFDLAHESLSECYWLQTTRKEKDIYRCGFSNLQFTDNGLIYPYNVPECTVYSSACLVKDTSLILSNAIKGDKCPYNVGDSMSCFIGKETELRTNFIICPTQKFIFEIFRGDSHRLCNKTGYYKTKSLMSIYIMEESSNRVPRQVSTQNNDNLLFNELEFHENFNILNGQPINKECLEIRNHWRDIMRLHPPSCLDFLEFIYKSRMFLCSFSGNQIVFFRIRKTYFIKTSETKYSNDYGLTIQDGAYFVEPWTGLLIPTKMINETHNYPWHIGRYYPLKEEGFLLMPEKIVIHQKNLDPHLWTFDHWTKPLNTSISTGWMFETPWAHHPIYSSLQEYERSVYNDHSIWETVIMYLKNKVYEVLYWTIGIVVIIVLFKLSRKCAKKTKESYGKVGVV